MKFIQGLFSRLRESTSSIKGFTMIELLIVIAILGVLAVAVLSAINPVEQINRGRDTGSRSDAEQLLSAIDRFNAFQAYYPWQSGGADVVYKIVLADSDLITWDAAGDVLQHTSGCQVSDLLSATNGTCVGSNELKVSFFTRIFGTSYNYLSIYHGANASDSTYVCFEPRSDAFKTEAKARCGTAGAGLPLDMADIAGEVCDDANATYLTCLP